MSGSQDNALSVPDTQWTGRAGTGIPVGARERFFPDTLQTSCRAYTTFYSLSAEGSVSEAKLPGREVDHSPPSSCMGKNVWR